MIVFIFILRKGNNYTNVRPTNANLAHQNLSNKTTTQANMINELIVVILFQLILIWLLQ